MREEELVRLIVFWHLSPLRRELPADLRAMAGQQTNGRNAAAPLYFLAVTRTLALQFDRDVTGPGSLMGLCYA
jgi:hypothetical protein